MFKALDPHPEDHLHLRLHRARSIVLTDQELVEIRAAQRTFEGAYMRTALGQLSFSLVVLKIFTSEFYPIGALFAAYGAAVMLVATYRRYEGNRQFFDTEEKAERAGEGITAANSGGGGGRSSSGSTAVVRKKKFRTSGNSVALLTALSFSAYVALIVLVWKL